MAQQFPVTQYSRVRRALCWIALIRWRNWPRDRSVPLARADKIQGMPATKSSKISCRPFCYPI